MASVVVTGNVHIIILNVRGSWLAINGNMSPNVYLSIKIINGDAIAAASKRRLADCRPSSKWRRIFDDFVMM